MEFKHGFEYMGVRYGWKDKKLYRLPFIRNLRSFNLKEIKPIIIGSTTCYNIQRNKKTINNLKKITKPVDWFVETYKTQDYPF